MAAWQHYDAKGNRVPKRLAKFKAMVVQVDSGGPAPPYSGSLAGWEYRDVQAITGSDAPKRFKSEKRMKEWFAEQAKGNAR